MIKITNLTKRYKNELKNTLNNINLTLPNKGLVFILGNSGAGKTTLASLIGGMDNEFEGSIKINDIELKDKDNDDLSDYRSNYISFSFQNGFLDLNETVQNEILKPLKLLDIEYEEYLKYLINIFELNGFENKKIKNLSGGERKRVSLIKALIKKSPIIILDEPTAGLNKKLSIVVFNELKKLANYSLILVITHDLEFVKDASFIKLSDGKILESKINGSYINYEQDKEVDKVGFIGRLFSIVRMVIKNFFNNLKSISPSCLAMALAITIAGFSSILVIGIKDGYSNLSTSSINSLSIVGGLKENIEVEYKNQYLTADQLFAGSQFKDDSVLYTGTKYMKDVNDIFTSDSGFSIQFSDWIYPKSYGLNLISNITLMNDYYLANFFPNVTEETILSDKEVFLGMTNNELEVVMEKMNIKGDHEKLIQKLKENVIKLNITAKIAKVNGVKNRSLTVKGIYINDRIELRHTNPMFSQEFFETNLGCLSSYEIDSLDPIPYTIKKAGVLYVKKDKIGSFYRNYLLTKSFENTNITKLSCKDSSKTIPLIFSYKQSNIISASDVKDIYFNEQYNVKNYSFSSSIYRYMSSGLFEGFTTPLFLSNEKSGLNEIADKQKITEYNMQSYVLSEEDIPKNVKVSSLLSTALGEGVLFLTPKDEKILLGRFPSTDKEIAISKQLAKILYGSEEKALSKTLHFLMLDNILIENGLYHNDFAEVSLRISGIIDNDKSAIYQDSLFPLVFGFMYTDLPIDYFNVDGFVLHFDSDVDRDYALNKLRSEYSEYTFSSPLKDLEASLNATLSKVGMGLSIFAIISIALSGFLLFLTIYLTIKKDERRIGELLALGYKTKEISFYYSFYAILIGLFSSLQSFIGLFIAKNIAIKQLSESFQSNSISIGYFPYLLSFAISISLSFIIGLLISLKTRKISPITAFRI